jgi:hypothetical protein
MNAHETTAVQKTNRLIITEWITTIAVFISCFSFLFYRIAQQSERTDDLYKIFCEESKRQDARTDKLYEMFIDLVKEKKT